MEKEICRIESRQKITTIFKRLGYVFAGFSALCFLSTLLVLTINSGWEYLLQLDSSYVIPIILGVIFAILAVCSFCIDKNTGEISISWVLTNNRIYGQIATLKIKQIESYNLNKITYYKLYQMTKKKTTYLTLMLKTSTDTVKFTVNEEFYNSFVNAVNATISITE